MSFESSGGVIWAVERQSSLTRDFLGDAKVRVSRGQVKYGEQFTVSEHLSSTSTFVFRLSLKHGIS